MNSGKLAGLTVFVTGSSRGIGRAVALKVAKDVANVVVAAKTTQERADLPGTIYSVCEEIEKAGGKALPCKVDVRDETAIQNAVDEAVQKFGGIDIVVNNASAISTAGTQHTKIKLYELMHHVNTRGTFLVSKLCLPHLKKSKHAHILNMSPPLNLNPFWFKHHLAYTISKYGMSLCVLGMHEEFRPFNIAVNALWPLSAIHTSAMDLIQEGIERKSFGRKPEMVADAAYAIITQDPKNCTGNFFVDEKVLNDAGITDMTQYLHAPDNQDRILPDLFFDGSIPYLSKDFYVPRKKSKKIEEKPNAAGSKTEEQPHGDVASLFKKIGTSISPEMVQKTRAIFVFNLTGQETGKWYIDLKNENGSCGPGEPSVKPDATITMDCKHFFSMVSGQLKPATAFMMERMKVEGNMQQALKLEKLMAIIKDKL
ncbi:unnamed protein product [Acanthoscelides obtectus]|uniref:Hydroxysteroid dehydrogenase-like protein 2 n=2 Tax=Acanthoscelides obtectus TaxID=200917 RepID=A0A9P0PX97_ACAOB|nr:unnamed protein product [Acanthoscelides obtectus]CAK1635983.1 Hydroxysteroid dehydrogenase-like protein 2 [Acanthoscelides obtectus]